MSLCCIRYSLINILSALKDILDNTDETREQSNIIELTDSSSSIETINELRVVQGIIKMIKVCDFFF